MSEKLLYDYFLDIENNTWTPWRVLIPNYIHDRNKRFSDILVPTINTLRTTWFVQMMNERDRPALLVGETGTSKTAIINEFLRNLSADKYVSFKQSRIILINSFV